MIEWARARTRLHQFNPHARRAVYWTRSVLPESYREYLASLPLGPMDVTAQAQLVHGAVSHEDLHLLCNAN
jgi:hypothetical protein